MSGGLDAMDALFSRWDREDRFRREYDLGSILLEAVEMSRRHDPVDGLRAMIRDTRSRLNPRPRKVSKAKTKRRAKAKAGRKANLARIAA